MQVQHIEIIEIKSLYIFSVLTRKLIYFQVKRGGNKNVTPYIIYASEIRKAVTDQNKNCSFGEISKIVGDKVCIFGLRIEHFDFVCSNLKKDTKVVCAPATKFSLRKFG